MMHRRERKRLLAAVAGPALLGLASATTGFAGQPASGSPSMEQLTPQDVVRKIEEAGYTDVRDVEYDNGHWEAEAIGKDGRRVDLRIDPTTGAVVPERD